MYQDPEPGSTAFEVSGKLRRKKKNKNKNQTSVTERATNLSSYYYLFASSVSDRVIISIVLNLTLT
jgi:hypothetical protein